nr:tripeptidyl-peptidase 2-like [Arachis hypogaea]
MEILLKIWIVIISFISVVPLFLIAQNFPKDYLKAHNDERVKVGAKPLKWDPQLASLARKFVKKHIFDCKKGIFDTTFAGNKYGQSNAYHLGSRSGVDAVNAWLTLKTNYDYKFNTCIDGDICLRIEAYCESWRLENWLDDNMIGWNGNGTSCQQAVNKHCLIFVSSAGNSRPILSTVSAPGSTYSSIISVGAYVSPAMNSAHSVVESPSEGIKYT